MGWKTYLAVALLLALSLKLSIAQPFGPPIYIANPDTLECRYYFSGDEQHFNPRPDNYTVNIGYTTDFKGQNQACDLIKCQNTGGQILLQDKDDPNPNVCVCPSGAFSNETGCPIIENAVEVNEIAPTETNEGKNNGKAISNSKSNLWVYVSIIAALIVGYLLGTKYRIRIKKAG